MDVEIKLNCANCKKLACLVGAKQKPANCPMERYQETYQEARNIYAGEEIKNIARNAGIVEAEGYGDWPRLKETIEFAKRMGYKKLGLPFCVGLQNEAAKIQKIMERYGLDIRSVNCKTGSFTKTEIGDLPEEYQMVSKTGHVIGFISCNPVAQALLLNEEGTDLNVLVGLCVGHDTLFIKHSEAPVTILITKDRRMGHNPAAAIYNYYGDQYFVRDQGRP